MIAGCKELRMAFSSAQSTILSARKNQLGGGLASMVKFVSEAPKRGPGAVRAFPQLSAIAAGLDGIHSRLEYVIHISP